MPGFGSGPFGHEAFGEWKWSREVLYETLPQIYRLEDELRDYVLEKYFEGYRASYDNIRRKIANFRDLRDPLRVRTQYDEVQILRLGKVIPSRGLIEQTGLDGLIDAFRNFSSPSSRFTSTDVGKEITVLQSDILGNNKTVTITSIVSRTSVSTDPKLAVDPGPFRWELRSYLGEQDYVTVEVQDGDVSTVTPGWELTDGSGQFLVRARRQLNRPEDEKLLLTDREGADGTVNADGYFVSPSAIFTQRDVGKKITTSGAEEDDNNTKQEIQHVESPTTVITSLMTILGVDSNGGVSYSALGADLEGNDLRVKHVVSGLGTSLSVSVDKGDITVALATDLAGNVTSTSSQVVAAQTPPSHSREQQSPSAAQRLRSPQGSQSGPPQSTSVSERFRTPSSQPGSTHRPSRQTSSAETSQSVLTSQARPAPQ